MLLRAEHTAPQEKFFKNVAYMLIITSIDIFVLFFSLEVKNDPKKLKPEQRDFRIMTAHS